MISVYTDADFLAAYKQKKKLFWIFWGITLFYLAFCIAWLIYHMSLPYGDPMDALPQTCVYVASALYIIIVLPFMSIKYSRISKYYKMLTYVNEGIKMLETNYFYTFREKSLQKDNLDVRGCVFETWSKKKQEWLEREAYWDVEKPDPALESGDWVRYITQSNFIIQYEVLQHKALEFEEYEEEEEVQPSQDEQEQLVQENQENQENKDDTQA